MTRHKGFTLIELMIALAIIAIIAAIAFPSYLKSAQRGRRADAKSALTQAAQALERCYTQYGSYNSTNCNEVATLTAGTTSQQGYYTINFAATTDISATTYKITATPVAGGVQAKDTDCLSMTIDNQGNQAPSSCW